MAGNTPLLFEPGRKSRFFERLAHGFITDLFHIAQGDEFLCQEPQRPASLALWLGSTGQGHQVRFHLPIEFAFLGARLPAVGE